MIRTMRAAVLLFCGDPRRESKQKRLPVRFLAAMHRALQRTIASIAGADLITVTNAGRETLGAQIDRAIAGAFRSGYGRVLIAAADVVLSRDILVRALATDGFVLGRSGDGGFYLAGFDQQPHWDWDAVVARRDRAADALIAAAGREPLLLPVVDDVDSYADAVRLTAVPLTALLRNLASLLTAPFVVCRVERVDESKRLSFDPLRGPPRLALPA
jgi:glycosyltransferase A (GT-A) superfamily protein (DUF2064 family)